MLDEWVLIRDHKGEKIVKVEKVKDDFVYFYNFLFNKSSNIKVIKTVSKPSHIETDWLGLFGRNVEYQYKYGRREKSNVIFVGEVNGEILLKMENGSRFYHNEIDLLDVKNYSQECRNEMKYVINEKIASHFTIHSVNDKYTKDSVVSMFLLTLWRNCAIEKRSVILENLPQKWRMYFNFIKGEKIDTLELIKHLFKIIN